MEWASQQIRSTDEQLEKICVRDGAKGILKIDLNDNQLIRVYQDKIDQELKIDLGETVTIKRFLSRTRDLKYNEAQVHYTQEALQRVLLWNWACPPGNRFGFA
ncbi:MAG: hypothetical protein R3C11_24680 [Planctomycetaceae bacterium]